MIKIKEEIKEKSPISKIAFEFVIYFNETQFLI